MYDNKKREKFEELAEKRVTDTVKKIRLIGNLSNRNNYDYSDQHVKQILSTLEEEIKILRAKFSESQREKDSTFKFK
ncbi:MULTISPECIES: hypothetical protein [Priestia]|uniref:Uncharacterized protein n=1 Tax=Priestia aryabhattai TaxID=412384 RepID=A0ABD7X3G6_PRIAR|nr:MULTISPECIES: hypothetical protein [Priestia]MEB4887660.1 hypothetical protein [Priestia megaterium]MED4032199.1 hypothetical protein [Priestia megaterium]MED4156385.1 hypothetical protein [Priestia aryabhattai]WDC91258.1 hypothetical protein PSR56_27330 [Priestia megaterium]WEA47190.1 hypothetical protein PWO00_27465 [Priestia aryabhattai]